MLVSVVHIFLVPAVPSFSYFSASQVQNRCVPINGSVEEVAIQSSNVGSIDLARGNSQPHLDLNHTFPADLHGAVIHRNASWKAEIGQWLSACDEFTKETDIIEVGTLAATGLLSFSCIVDFPFLFLFLFVFFICQGAVNFYINMHARGQIVYFVFFRSFLEI